MLRQHVDAHRVAAVALPRARPQLDLRHHLVGERRAHHVGRVAGAAAQVHEAPFREQDDPLAVREDHVVDLRLDVLPLAGLEARDVDLVVEVADVAHDRVVLHPLHVLERDHVDVARRRHEDVGLVAGVVHRDDAVALHRRLQRADRVDLGDPHLRREGAQRLRAALADVAVARDDRDLARDHHVGRALDAVDERLAAAVEVVELRLGDRVVDVDRREAQPLLLRHLVEALDAGRRLLGHALDRRLAARVERRVRGELGLDRREERALLLVGRMRDARRVALGLRAQVDEQRRVAAVVEDHVRHAAVLPLEDPVRVRPVLVERLALDREHRRAARGDRGGGVVLRRVDVARRPADVGAERLQRLDQHRGLDRHVQRARDAGAAQRLFGREFLADRHEAGHLGLRDQDLLASPVGEREVGDVKVLHAMVVGCVHASHSSSG